MTHDISCVDFHAFLLMLFKSEVIACSIEMSEDWTQRFDCL